MSAITKEKIKEIRKEMHKTQTELAEMLGVKLRTVQYWESGKRDMPLSAYKLLTTLHENYAQRIIDLENKSHITQDLNGTSVNSYQGQLNVINIPFVHRYAQVEYLENFANSDYIRGLPLIPFILENTTLAQYHLAFEVTDSSMDINTTKSYLPGNKVLSVKVNRKNWIKDLDIDHWDFVIIHKEHGVLIRRISELDIEQKTLKLAALNKLYEDLVVNFDDVLQIFRITYMNQNQRR